MVVHGRLHPENANILDARACSERDPLIQSPDPE